jgi:hypothetical protein
MQEGQRHQVCRDTESKLDRPAIANGGFAILEIDLHVVMIEENLVEWMDRLEHGLLGNKDKPSMIGIVTDIDPFQRGRNDLQQFRGQALRRLDIYSNGTNVTARSDGRNGHTSIVAERAGNSCRPNGRARRGPRQSTTGCPSRVRRRRATMRAAPLARLTLTTLDAKAGGDSSGNKACSSPGVIKRWPIRMPGTASESMALSSEG